jgi:hypothetical protein
VASGQSDALDLTCRGRRIGRIVVDNGDVFTPKEDDPRALRWATSLANFLHVRTTRSFIRKELLFSEGDCLDDFLLSESRRLLDGYRFLREVRITVRDDEDGGDQDAVVYVETRDEWSTQVDLGVTYDGGLNFERLRATETNFLGQGVRADLTRVHRRERDDRSIRLSTPRFFGRANASIGYGRSPGGDFFNQGIGYPFVGEVGRTSLSEGFARSSGFVTYTAGEGAPFSHIQVPQTNTVFELAGAGRLGKAGSATVLGLSFAREEWRRNGPVQFVRGAAFDDREPASEELPDPIRRQVGNAAMTLLSVHLGTRRFRYVPYQGLDAIRDVQTIDLGYFAGLSVGKGFDLATPRGSEPVTDYYGRVHASFGRLLGSTFVHGSVNGQGGHSPDGWRDFIASADLVSYTRAGWLPNQTLFFRASGGGGWNTYRPHQLTLGGRDGVRSLVYDQIPGGRRVVLFLEDRIRLDYPKWNTVDLGMTLLADAGKMWAGDAPFGENSQWYGSAGFGLRLGLPSGSRNIWRVDVAFPVGRSGSPVFRIAAEINRYFNRFGTPKLGRGTRYRRGPESF